MPLALYAIMMVRGQESCIIIVVSGDSGVEKSSVDIFDYTVTQGEHANGMSCSVRSSTSAHEWQGQWASSVTPDPKARMLRPKTKWM
jgi:hypothetical protein